MHNFLPKYIFHISVLLAFSLTSMLVNGQTWEEVKTSGKGEVTVCYYNSDNFISDASGELKGIEYDIFLAFKDYLRKKGIDLNISFKKSESFSELYEGIKHGGSGEFGACSFSMTEKRIKEVSFSPKYMPDIEVLINSSNIPVVSNEDEFIRVFSELTALNVPNTTFEEDLEKLKFSIPNLKIENVETASDIREKVLAEDDYFGYIELPNYLQLFQDGLRFRRQNLFKVERTGYGIILPKNSSWLIPINEFFDSDEFKREVNGIIKKHLGEGVNELLWEVENAVENKSEQELVLLRMERDAQEGEIAQQQLKLQILVGGVLVILIIAFLLFYSYRMKRMANKSLTDRNALIENQKEELERLSLVASKTSNGVLILDYNNRIEWLNDAYEKITGYGLAELKGESPGDILISEKTDKNVLNGIRQQIKESKSWNERILVNRKDKSEVWLGINSTPVFNYDNEIIKYIEIIEDVTVQVKSEIDLNRLSIVAEKMNEAVVITDAEGNVEYYNYGLVRNSGFSEEEFRVHFKDMMHLKKLASREDIDEIIEGFKSNPAPILYDSQHVKKDGTTMWTAASLSPVYDDENSLSKIIIVYTDIDERKVFANQLSEINEEISDSIKYAQRIQDAILPSDELFKSYFPSSFVLYKPKDVLSGDFYWVSEATNNKGKELLLAAVADCTGHGVPGALMSIIGNNYLRLCEHEASVNNPGEGLDFINRGVSKTLRQEFTESTIKDGMDISFIALDYPNMKLYFAGAKTTMYLIRENELIQYKGDKHPVGAYVGENLIPFTNNEIEIQKNDIIYLFSDGFADQFGGKSGKKFMYKRFRELLISIKELDMDGQKESLENAFYDWKGDLDQLDDVCVMGIKI